MASITVNQAFLDKPQGSDKLKDGDDAIVEEKLAWYERTVLEHVGLIGDTQSRHGEHRKGSAMCYYQSAAPTTKPDGSTSLDVNDTGRLWMDTDTDTLYMYKGTVDGWKRLITSTVEVHLSGNLFVDTDIIPAILIPIGFVVTKVLSKLGTAPTGANDVRFDVNKNGSDSIFTTGYVELGDTTVDTETTLTAHATLAAGDYLTIDIDQVGSTIGGADLTITLFGGTV